MIIGGLRVGDRHPGRGDGTANGELMMVTRGWKTRSRRSPHLHSISLASVGKRRFVRGREAIEFIERLSQL